VPKFTTDSLFLSIPPGDSMDNLIKILVVEDEMLIGAKDLHAGHQPWL